MKIWLVFETCEHEATYFRKAFLSKESAEKFCDLKEEKRSVECKSEKRHPGILFDIRQTVWWDIEEVEAEE